MTDFEKKFKKANHTLIKELTKLEKECDTLISRYSQRILSIAIQLDIQKKDPKRETLYKHQVATSAKLGAAEAFKRTLQIQINSLSEIQHQTKFNPNEYYEKFRVTHQKVKGWANKILSDEAPKEVKQHYRPFTRILKTIGNIILPFTVVVPLVKMATQGRNHFFFTRKTNIENLAEDTLFRLKRHQFPSLS